MDEDPWMVGHLLWVFLAINLTGAALAIHANCGESNCFDVLRRINEVIFPKLGGDKTSCIRSSAVRARLRAPKKSGIRTNACIDRAQGFHSETMSFATL